MSFVYGIYGVEEEKWFLLVVFWLLNIIDYGRYVVFFIIEIKICKIFKYFILFFFWYDFYIWVVF